MTFGQKIRAAREDLDLLQSDMARLIPMNQSNYSKIERDVQEPSLDQLKRICQVLKLDPAYLLGLERQEISSEREKYLLSDLVEIIEKYKS